MPRSELLGSPGPTLCLPENIIVIIVNLIVRERFIFHEEDGDNEQCHQGCLDRHLEGVHSGCLSRIYFSEALCQQHHSFSSVFLFHLFFLFICFLLFHLFFFAVLPPAVPAGPLALHSGSY